MMKTIIKAVRRMKKSELAVYIVNTILIVAALAYALLIFMAMWCYI
jgi:hypothetical protein